MSFNCLNISRKPQEKAGSALRNSPENRDRERFCLLVNAGSETPDITIIHPAASQTLAKCSSLNRGDIIIWIIASDF